MVKNRKKLLSLFCISTYDTTALPLFTWNKYITVHTWASNPNLIFDSNTGPDIRNKKDHKRADIPNHLDRKQAWKPNAGNHERARWSILPSWVANQKTGFAAVVLPARGFSHMITKLYSPSNTSNMPLQWKSSREWKMSKGKFLKRLANWKKWHSKTFLTSLGNKAINLKPSQCF